MVDRSPSRPTRPGTVGRAGLPREQVPSHFDDGAADYDRLVGMNPGYHDHLRASAARMRLPRDGAGLRLLDAGCGTGALAVAAARRGAEVVAIDLSPNLVEVARERAAQSALRGRIDWRSGDMLDAALGDFDHVIAMDSLIHYEGPDAMGALATLIPRVRSSIVWTFAPRTPLLSVMHAVGRLFPQGDRAPRIVPVAESMVRQAVATRPELAPAQVARTQLVKSGFYTSQAMELTLTPRRMS
jgi:magnesium-protoporphyrin O-methyltransferase